MNKFTAYSLATVFCIFSAGQSLAQVTNQKAVPKPPGKVKPVPKTTKAPINKIQAPTTAGKYPDCRGSNKICTQLFSYPDCWYGYNQTRGSGMNQYKGWQCNWEPDGDKGYFHCVSKQGYPAYRCNTRTPGKSPVVKGVR